jgi:predicted dehydrogenase
LRESDADAVLNLTPIQLHTEVTLAALAVGKHVYTEKPLASNADDGWRIAKAAEAAKRIVVCAPCVMLWPQVLYAKQLLERGEIDAVYLARGRGWGGVPPWSGYTSDPSPFFARDGGVLRDMGVYPLHALTGLFGPVRRVMAMSAQVQRSFTPNDGPAAGRSIRIEEPDNWVLLLDFGGNRLATLESNNAAQATQAPELELMGLRGSIALNLIDAAEPVHVMRATGDWGWTQHRFPNSGRASGPDHLIGVAHLLDCIERRAEPVLNLKNAIHVLDVIDAAMRSARTGEAVSIGGHV